MTQILTRLQETALEITVACKDYKVLLDFKIPQKAVKDSEVLQKTANLSFKWLQKLPRFQKTTNDSSGQSKGHKTWKKASKIVLMKFQNILKWKC